MAKKRSNSKVMYNFPGWYDVFNRPQTPAEQKAFTLKMVTAGQAREAMIYQEACMQYKADLRLFLNDINTLS